MVVELMASIPARKMQSILLHPKAWPTRTPSVIMQKTMATVAMMGEAPIFNIFLNEKSKPREKSVKMTPMSAQV